VTLIPNLQALTLADNPAFRNALVSMRPRSTTADLPSSYDVKQYLHNRFVKHIAELKEVITVSVSSFKFLRDGIEWYSHEY
jgi:hypothetical protein